MKPSPDTAGPHPPRLVAGTLVVFIAALAFQIPAIVQYGDDPFRDRLVSDALSYDRWASRIAANGLAAEPVFHQAPLFPLVLAGLHATLPPTSVTPAALIVQALLTAAALAFIVPLGGLYLGSTRAGILGGALVLLHAPFVFYGLKLVGVPLALASQAAAWLLLARARSAGASLLRPAIAGAALGVAALARSEMLVAVPIFAAAVAVGPDRRRRLAAVSVCLLGCVVAIAPATVHNLRQHDVVLIASSGGENLFIGNQRGARGAYSAIHPRAGDLFSERVLARALAEQEAGRELRPSEISRHWRSKAVDEVLADPLGWLRLETLKLGRILHPGDPTDAYSLALERDRYLPVLRLLPLPAWTLLLSGFAGVALALRRRPAAAWPVAAAVAVQLAVLLLFFVNTRLRLPLLYALAPFGGFALERAVDALRSGRRRAVPVAFVSVLVVASVAGAILTRATPRDHVRLASVLSSEGRLDEALEALEPVLAVDAPDGLVLDQAGWILQRRGELESARRHYRDALDAGLTPPHRVQTRTRLAMVLERLGRIEESGVEHDLAVAAEHATAGTYYERGMFLVRLGRADEGARDLREATRLDPAWPAPRRALERLESP